MIFPGNIAERVAGGNRPGINSSGTMLKNKPGVSFTSSANNYNLQSLSSIHNPGTSGGGKKITGSVLNNNNNYRSPSPTFQGVGAYSFVTGIN